MAPWSHLVVVQRVLALQCSDDLLNVLDLIEVGVHTGARGAVPPGQVPQLQAQTQTQQAQYKQQAQQR